MAMTPRERVQAAMNKENLDRPPVAIFTQSATLGQMDALGAAWPEAHKNPDLMATLAAGTIECFDMEGARTAFCLTAESERFGLTVAVDKKDAAPMIKDHSYHFDCMNGVYDDLAEKLMPVDEFLAGGRPAVVIESCRILKENKVKGVKKWDSEKYRNTPSLPETPESSPSVETSVTPRT